LNLVQHKRAILIILSVLILVLFVVGFWLRGRHLDVYNKQPAPEKVQPGEEKEKAEETPASIPADQSTTPAPPASQPTDGVTYPTPAK
jgi:cytoskeletal protein RodZ